MGNLFLDGTGRQFQNGGKVFCAGGIMLGQKS
jgi:hypothetical protein